MEDSRSMITLYIPAYNKQHAIRATLDSVAAQTDQNFRCVVINDGSTDGTAEICKEYCENYGWLFLDKPHSGLPDTLNYGIQQTQPEYIMMLDADDYLRPKAIKSLNAVLECNHTEAIEYLVNTPQYYIYSPTIIRSLDTTALEDRRQAVWRGLIPAYRWNKILSYELWNRIIQYYNGNIGYGEDVLFTAAFYTCVRSLTLLGMSLLDYEYLPDGLTHSSMTERLRSLNILFHKLKHPDIYQPSYYKCHYESLYGKNLTEAKI